MRPGGVADAVDALIAPDDVRRDFFGHERLVRTLLGAVKPNPAAIEFAERAACLVPIADTMRATLNPNPTDIAHVMGGITDLLDASITGMVIRDDGPPVLDLSRIDKVKCAAVFEHVYECYPERDAGVYAAA